MGVGSGRYALGPGRGTAARTGEESTSSSEVGKRKQYVYDLEKARWLKLLYYLKPLWFILCISSDMWLQSFISCLIEVVSSQYLFMYHRHLSDWIWKCRMGWVIRGQTHGKEKQFPGIRKLKITYPQSQTGVSEVLSNGSFLIAHCMWSNFLY